MVSRPRRLHAGVARGAFDRLLEEQREQASIEINVREAFASPGG